MRRPFAALVYVGSLLISAKQSVAQHMPGCAGICLINSIEAQNDCAPTDTACICTNTPLTLAIQNCFVESCTVIDALAAHNATQSMCGAEVRDKTHINPIITGVSGIVALLGVFVRLWMSGRDFWIDDAMCVIATLFAVPMAALAFVMSGIGFGKDIWTIDPENIYVIVQYTWMSEILWFASIGCTKLAFLFLYLRIFSLPSLRRITKLLIGIESLSVIAFTLVATVNCLPLSYIWTSWDGQHSGKCINFHVVSLVQAILDIVLDCVLIGLAILELRKIQMSMKEKIMITSMFIVGGAVTIISILRLQSLISFAHSTNPTWDHYPTAYWSTLSCFLGIFCACMPALRRFFASIFPVGFALTRDESSDNSDGDVVATRVGNGHKRSKSMWSSFDSVMSLPSRMKRTSSISVKTTEDDEEELVTIDRARVVASEWSQHKNSDLSLDRYITQPAAVAYKL